MSVCDPLLFVGLGPHGRDDSLGGQDVVQEGAKLRKEDQVADKERNRKCSQRAEQEVAGSSGWAS